MARCEISFAVRSSTLLFGSFDFGRPAAGAVVHGRIKTEDDQHYLKRLLQHESSAYMLSTCKTQRKKLVLIVHPRSCS